LLPDGKTWLDVVTPIAAFLALLLGIYNAAREYFRGADRLKVSLAYTVAPLIPVIRVVSFSRHDIFIDEAGFLNEVGEHVGRFTKASTRPVGENRCVPARGSREFYLTEQEAEGYSEKTFLGVFARTTTGKFFYAFVGVEVPWAKRVRVWLLVRKWNRSTSIKILHG